MSTLAELEAKYGATVLALETMETVCDNTEEKLHGLEAKVEKTEEKLTKLKADVIKTEIDYETVCDMYTQAEEEMLAAKKAREAHPDWKAIKKARKE